MTQFVNEKTGRVLRQRTPRWAARSWQSHRGLAGPRGGPQGARSHAPQGRPGIRGMPHKLADCQERDPERCELFLWRANRPAAPPSRAATGASRPSCRSKGKILNVGKGALRQDARPRGNPPPMITALGTGIGKDDFDRNQVALRQDHHHDRRGRGWFAHPHPPADVLLPAHD